MAALTIKNIPDDLYEKLKASASVHHRSINSELIHCLEIVLMPRRLTAAERVGRARALRPDIPSNVVSPTDIMDAIEQGRP
ncbi:MAG: Arc family DNA-binding protein [bacterium]|nr:Arc family DNA-binding protein [bacterium]